MSKEGYLVSTFDSELKIEFGWTLRNWRSSSKYVQFLKGDKKDQLFESPDLSGADGSTWKLAVHLLRNMQESVKISFLCFCLQRPSQNGILGCEIRGELSIPKLECGEPFIKHEIDFVFGNPCNLPQQILQTQHKKLDSAPQDLAMDVRLRISGWERPNQQLSTEHSQSILTLLTADEEFTDLVIRIRDQQFYGHKVVFALRSPVLKEMVCADTEAKKKAVIELNDVSPQLWPVFKHFLYTEQLPKGVVGEGETLEIPILLELLMISNSYQVPSLTKHVEEAIIERMKPDNVLEILPAVEKLGFSRIKDHACKIIVQTKREMTEGIEAVNQPAHTTNPEVQ